MALLYTSHTDVRHDGGRYRVAVLLTLQPLWKLLLQWLHEELQQ